MNKSASIMNLAVALSLAQAKMPTVKFDAKNPFLKNKYATLGAVIEATRPILSEFGLSISQFPTGNTNQFGVSLTGLTTILMHSSGEWLEETIYLPPEDKKGLSINQNAGVTLTYLRRYAWASILGLYADEDVDGNNSDQAGSGETDEKVKAVMARNWTAEQTEAVSVAILDAGLEPIDAADATVILDMSVLPGDAPIKTIKSWVNHYIKSEGKSPLIKAADANEAYQKAKKGAK